MNKLADKLRSGEFTLTVAELDELETLEAEFRAGAPAPRAMRSHWDSPVAKACFEGDNR